MSSGPVDARASWSRTARSPADRIEVRGFDLAVDLLGRVNLEAIAVWN
ncbi:MAG: hypothetical protein ACRENY_07185 [Candidatus Dormibacteria bacterium]